MDKEILKELLKLEKIKNDQILHFYVKACEIVLDKYGGKVEDWYCAFPNKKENEETDENKKEIFLLSVQDNRLDRILVICEHDSSKNKKTISLFKSTLSFKNIVSIVVDSENIKLNTSSESIILPHLKPLTQEVLDFEKFHKVLIRKFDDYCDVEYNYFKNINNLK